MGSNKNVVISFSIAILLLLSLLLLLTYNSKCSGGNKSQMSMDNSQVPTGFLTDSEKYYNYETFASGPAGAASAEGGAAAPAAAPTASGARSVADNYRSNPSLASSGIGNYSPDNPNYNPSQMLDGSQSGAGDSSDGMYASVSGSGSGGAGVSGGVGASGGASGMGGADGSPASGMQSCFPRDRLTAGDLLPKDAADSKWARINPSGTGDIHDQNYLTAGYHVGINTVGQSLRNANLQLRSEIPNPQNAVGPWMISTIEPDLRQNTLEIGSSATY
jgi:hypothetical protein